ncbi:hypothetical protein MPER_03291, partial [Moniliophthora perniciosa FA553]
MRWHPALPLGFPHMATEADSYKGYYIPQGTTVFSNIWAMTHDEDIYPDPYEFKPERFLNTNGSINDVLAYGFGRRKEKDEQGNEIDIPEHYSDGPGFFSITSRHAGGGKFDKLEVLRKFLGKLRAARLLPR